MNLTQTFSALAFLLVATTLEVNGDALVRMAIYNHTGFVRLGLMLAGALLLFGYGFTLNLAPLEFGHIEDLYVLTISISFSTFLFLDQYRHFVVTVN